MRITRSLLLAACVAGAAAAVAAGQSAPPAPRPAAPFDVNTINVKLNLDIPGKLQVGDFPGAERICTEIIDQAKQQVETPEIRAILIRAYEARARARVNIEKGLERAREDFYNLLTLAPSHELTPPVSEEDARTYREVRDTTLGHIALSMEPAGTAKLERIDGYPYTIALELNAEPRIIDLVAGSYRVTATTATGSYDQLDEQLTVTRGTDVQVKVLKLVRRTSTFAVTSIPAGVEVLIDGVSRGRTAAREGGGPGVAIADLQPAEATRAALQAATRSDPLVIDDLLPGEHTLQLRLPCFRSVEAKFTIVRQGEPRRDTFVAGDLTPETFRPLLPDHVEQGAFRLTPATAALRLQGLDADATLYLDGEKREAAPADVVTICAGPHTIEVRGRHGRFLDTRTWNASDSPETLVVEMRPAFAIGNMPPGQALTDVQRRALAAVNGGRAVVYLPYEQELAAAAADAGLAPDFWSPNPADNISREGRVLRWRQLGERLQAQGLAALSVGADPALVRVSILAPGSGVASVVEVHTEDPVSVSRAREAFAAVLPPFWRPTVGVSVVDADHVRGAVIVRVDPGGAAARAGLKPGSTIVAAGGQPVASVADWRAALQKVAPGAPIAVDVQGPDQTAVPLIVGIEADALPFVTGSTSLRGSPLPANLALVNLQDAVARAGTTPAGAGIARAAWLNQAIVHRQLGNWAEALAALDRAAPSDATDAAAAGVIAYYKGLCLEQLDRRDAADAEFQKAAAARTARLSPDGPLVWPLAQAKIRPAR